MRDRVTGEVVLHAADLRKSYGSVVAIDAVTVTVHRGEFVALLGPNGAGKSTLLQILSGLFVPDRGAVSIMGADIRDNLTRALASLGVVFQQPTLDLELTVEANLLYHADLHGLPRSIAKARIDKTLERFELSDRRKAKARTLSGGNRRKVELARSLLHEPSLLLMDEATVGLDPASRRDILDRILKLKDSGRIGVLWTTHLVDEVRDADRVVVLYRGKVVFDGAPAQLVEREGASDLSEAFLKLTGAPAPALTAS